MRKEAKLKRWIFFLFRKRRKKIFLDFFLQLSETFGLNKKTKSLVLYFLLVFLQAVFLFLKIIGIFFLLFTPYQKDINVGHDFQKIPMTMKISHGGVCIFVMGVILLCDPMAYVLPSLLSSSRLHGVNSS